MIDRADYDRLKALAYQQERSVSALIRLLIRRALTEQERVSECADDKK